MPYIGDGSGQDSPMYREMMAQVLRGSQRGSQYPGEAGANAIATMLQAYSAKKFGQQEQAKEDARGKAYADAFAPVTDPALLAQQLDTQTPGTLENQAGHTTAPDRSQIMAKLLANPDVANQLGPALAAQQLQQHPVQIDPSGKAYDPYNTPVGTQFADPRVKPQAVVDQEKDLKAAPGPVEQPKPQSVIDQELLLKGAPGAPPQPSAGMTPDAEAQQIRVDKAKAAATAGTIQPADDPIVQSWVKNVLGGNATMQQVPAPLRNSVSMAITDAPKEAYSPLAASRFSTASNRITSNFIKLPQFELTANGLPYLQRIDAAMKTPGSVSDQDLLDSLTKLNTAGNAITDAQVKIITDGKSFSDMAGTFANRFKNGGVLSENQRGQIQSIAKAIYANYKKGYQPVYDQVTKQLSDAGIPKAFWTIPDLNSLSDQGTAGQRQAGGGSIDDLVNQYKTKPR